MDHNMTDIMN